MTFFENRITEMHLILLPHRLYQLSFPHVLTKFKLSGADGDALDIVRFSIQTATLASHNCQLDSTSLFQIGVVSEHPTLDSSEEKFERRSDEPDRRKSIFERYGVR